MISDDELETALSRLPEPAEPEADDACLGAQDLAAYVEGACSPEERERVEAHLASCRACLGELDAAARWLDVPPRVAPAAPVRPPRLRTSQPRWLAAVAGLALAASAVPLLLGPRQAAEGRREEVAGAGPFRQPALDPRHGLARRAVGDPRDGALRGLLRLTPELRALLRSHSPDPADHAPLLSLLEAGPLRVPAARVARVEIDPDLLLPGSAAREVEVTLDAEGRLALRRAP